MPDKKDDLLDAAWGIIANAGWDPASGITDIPKTDGWHEAAIRWRDEYFRILHNNPEEREMGPGDLDRDTSSSFNAEEYHRKARMVVVDYFNDRKDKTEDFELGIGGTYIVWFCKVLQNWKALVSTVVPDGRYYEVTCDGDKGKIYLDVYQKFQNLTIADEVIVLGGHHG